MMFVSRCDDDETVDRRRHGTLMSRLCARPSFGIDPLRHFGAMYPSQQAGFAAVEEDRKEPVPGRGRAREKRFARRRLAGRPRDPLAIFAVAQVPLRSWFDRLIPPWTRAPIADGEFVV